jgi:glycosyltransferase involved in cell wall biosynthesis
MPTLSPALLDCTVPAAVTPRRSEIAHLTSAHPRNDTRIFLKQCRTLVKDGHNVTLVVADDQGNETSAGVTIVDVGRIVGRMQRIFTTTRRILEKAIELDVDIYHLHDPELIPIGLALKRRGKIVIFDSHEDVQRQLLSKPYLGPLSRRVVSRSFALLERYACARFDGIIGATPSIRDSFLKINPRTVDVNNFPLMSELTSVGTRAENLAEVSYVGGISAIRGIRELVKAGEFLHSPTRINLVGRFSEDAIEAEVKKYRGWQRINQHGVLNRDGVRDVLQRSAAGVVTFHPLPNHLDALPTKMFEYMSSGTPVIASNFALWRDIVEGNQCGICVDPRDPRAIAAAIDYLVTNPAVAKDMGENGQKAVSEKYNWALQATKLTDFYGVIENVRKNAKAI